MLLVSDLLTWATANVPAGTAVVANRMQDASDQVVMVAIAHGGKGFLTDGAFQQVVVHVRSRADTDAEAETIALAMDAALLNNLPMTMTSGCVVRNAYPMAGPPCYFERDTENRTSYFCDYMLEASR